MSAGWTVFVTILTLASIAGMVWLLITNRNKPSSGDELDHDFDGIREFDNPLPAWWVGLFVATIIFGLGYTFYYPTLGAIEGAGEWSSAKEWLYSVETHDARFAGLFKNYASQEHAALVKDRKAMQTGRRLYLNYCSTCHGVTAKGGEGFPDLTDNEWIWGGEFEQIKQSITHGRVAAMPPWAAALQPEQLNAVSVFVESMSEPTDSDSDHDLGRSTYSTFCSACHGVDGKGSSQLGAPDLTNDVWLYGGSSAQITQSIAEGRAGKMPSQLALLGEDKVHLLSAYIYSLSQSDLAPKPSGQ